MNLLWTNAAWPIFPKILLNGKPEWLRKFSTSWGNRIFSHFFLGDPRQQPKEIPSIQCISSEYFIPFLRTPFSKDTESCRPSNLVMVNISIRFSTWQGWRLLKHIGNSQFISDAVLSALTFLLVERIVWRIIGCG